MRNRSPQSKEQKISSIVEAMKNGATTIKEIMDKMQISLPYAEMRPLIKQLKDDGIIVTDTTGFGFKLVEATLTNKKSTLGEEDSKPEIKTKFEQENLKEILKEFEDIDKNKLISAYFMIKEVIEGKNQNSLYDIASLCGISISIAIQISDYIKRKKEQELSSKLISSSKSRRKRTRNINVVRGGV